MKKSLTISILVGSCFLWPLSVPAEQESCDQILKECREEAEKDLGKCIKEAEDMMIGVFEMTCETDYKRSSKEFQSCVEQFQSNYRGKCTETFRHEWDICAGVYETCKEDKEGKCWFGSLKVKVHEKIERQYQKTNVETGRSSYNLDAKGHVMFRSGEGKKNIISKNLSGYRSSTFFGDTGCVIHEGDTKGILTEGIMSKKGMHIAYWKINFKVRSTIKSIEGCMQDPIPPIKGTEEEEDWRFEGIVHPDIGKLVFLCSTVKSTPGLGHCTETYQGFYGVMIKSMGPLPDKDSRGEGSEVYEWYAKKVPCE